MRLAIAPVLVTLLASSATAEGVGFGFDAIEWHDRIIGRELTYEYDVFCLQKSGFLVEIGWDAVSDFGDASSGQMPVRLYNMGMIDCPHGWDLHEMGNVWQGNGGSKWVAVYDGHYLIQFSALEATIKYSTDGKPLLHAVVHPLYCNNETDRCEVEKPLPIFVPDE